MLKKQEKRILTVSLLADGVSDVQPVNKTLKWRLVNHFFRRVAIHAHNTGSYKVVYIKLDYISQRAFKVYRKQQWNMVPIPSKRWIVW